MDGGGEDYADVSDEVGVVMFLLLWHCHKHRSRSAYSVLIDGVLLCINGEKRALPIRQEGQLHLQKVQTLWKSSV